MNLHVMNPTVDVITVEVGDGKTEERLVIRGILDPLTLDGILVDSYQRDIVPGQKVSALMHAARTSVLPDIELGIRGSKYKSYGEGTQEQYFSITDHVYVIDGYQRINALREVMKHTPAARPRIGALIHVDTTFDWERDRFRILNMERSKVSPNVLLRNSRHDHVGIDTVHSMCLNDHDFKLHGRVSWDQRMARNQLVTAARMCVTISMLHSRFVAGGGSDDSRDLPRTLDQLQAKIGANKLRSNCRYFFDLIEECWGITNIKYRERSPQLKGTFLKALARFFTDHDQFWKGYELFLQASDRRKLKKFPINDPSVQQLCGSGGRAMSVLVETIRDHMNRGKRTQRLELDGADDNGE